MAEINFPAQVTDPDWHFPSGTRNVRSKKLDYVFIAVEKLRVLHNAGWTWHRGETLDADEQALLAAEFPGLWPTPPTEAQLRNYIETYWEPRHNAAQETRTIYRRAVTPAHFSYVDLDGLI